MFNELCEFKLPKSFLRVRLRYVSSILLSSQSGLIQSPHQSALRSDNFFYSKLNVWATSNPTLLVEDDIHRISQHSQMLSLAYFSISDSFQKKSKEAAQRFGVDLITKLAFDSEDTSIHNLLCVSWFGHP